MKRILLLIFCFPIWMEAQEILYSRGAENYGGSGNIYLYDYATCTELDSTFIPEEHWRFFHYDQKKDEYIILSVRWPLTEPYVITRYSREGDFIEKIIELDHSEVPRNLFLYDNNILLIPDWRGFLSVNLLTQEQKFTEFPGANDFTMVNNKLYGLSLINGVFEINLADNEIKLISNLSELPSFTFEDFVGIQKCNDFSKAIITIEQIDNLELFLYDMKTTEIEGSCFISKYFNGDYSKITTQTLYREMNIEPVNLNIDTTLCKSDTLFLQGMSYSTFGMHMDTILDSNSCDSVFLAININEHEDVLFNYSYMLNEGEFFDAAFQFDDVDLSTIQWSPQAGLSCSDCLSPTFNPLSSQQYSMTAHTLHGCSLNLYVDITIVPQYEDDIFGDYYLPNCISKNLDRNNIFYLQGPMENDFYYDMLIYNKWGNLEYSQENLTVNESINGWQPSALKNGVYIYRIVIQNKIRVGSFTVF